MPHDDILACERALAAAHTRIADQSTTIEAAFMAKCEAERALEAARAESDALKAQLDHESVQHWDAMRAERDAARAEVERLRQAVDGDREWILRSRYTEAVKEHITTLRARVAELERHLGFCLDFIDTNGDPMQVRGHKLTLGELMHRIEDARRCLLSTAAVLRSVVETKEKQP